MPSAVAEAKFKEVIQAVKTCLGVHGYRKQGLRFRRFVGDNVALLEVQRSAWNEADEIRFTLNVAVISGRLAALVDRDTKKAGSVDAHLNERLGFFLDPPRDFWWTVCAGQGASDTSANICALLASSVVPFLDRTVSDQALIELWSSGRSPGLTERQRQRYLTELQSTVSLGGHAI